MIFIGGSRLPHPGHWDRDWGPAPADRDWGPAPVDRDWHSAAEELLGIWKTPKLPCDSLPACMVRFGNMIGGSIPLILSESERFSITVTGAVGLNLWVMTPLGVE